MKKFTKREMFEAIAKAMETGNSPIAPDAIIEFCENEIDQLNKKAAKAKERQIAKKSEIDELGNAVHGVLTDEYQTIADIAAVVDHPDATVSKVTWRLNKLVDNGIAEKTDVKVPGAEGVKTRTIKAFRLADISAPVED